MAERVFVSTAWFRRAYRRLQSQDQEIVDRALLRLADYFRTGRASVGLGVKKFGDGVLEARAGLALRVVYVDEGTKVVLALLGSHDDVRRFLRRQ